MFYNFIIKYTDIFVENMREATAKVLTFFNKNIGTFEILTFKINVLLTNDVVNFEQPGPVVFIITESFERQ